MKFRTAHTSRRQMVQALGGGLGAVGLAGLLCRAVGGGQSCARTFAPRAKRVIQLFMNGGPFRSRPLRSQAGHQPVRRPAAGRGRSAHRAATAGLLAVAVQVRAARRERPAGQRAACRASPQRIDDLCVLRSLLHRQPQPRPGPVPDEQRHDHADAAQHGLVALLRPGQRERRTCRGYVVLCPGRPVRFAELWTSSFLPAEHQGTYINHSRARPARS